MPSRTTLRNASPVAARFGSDYSYSFEGDTVTLQASAHLVHYLEHEVQWLLQLRASPVNTTSTKTAYTHVIAEVTLPPLTELTSTGDICSLTTHALPPAGQGEFNLSLALISRRAEQIDELHDIAFFSRPERFAQPRLGGPITCSFAQNELSLAVDRIENPRDTANVSGTLSLELWALNTPYEGGIFHGEPLAGAILGRLSGQESWTNTAYTLHYAPPTAGSWQVALMLREWTGSSYTTRDYFNFAAPLVIEPKPTATPTSSVAAKAPSAPASATTKKEPVIATPAKTTPTAKTVSPKKRAKSSRK